MKLTIFTPTYNRAHLLPKAYDALKKQTNKDFIWLIIDDGSVDGTETLIRTWIKYEHEFKIKYIYKQNGGLHTAYNKAIELLDTELAVCVDSDDYLVETAVEDILNKWNDSKKLNVAGIIALDCYESGEIVGDYLPNIETINLIDLQVGKFRIDNGDRKLIVRSELYKAVAPQETYKNEKNFNPHYMHLKISKTHDFAVFNKPLCVVEYQPSGMTANIYKQYWNSPNSFAEMRRLYLSFPNTSLGYQFRQCVHYVSSSIIARDLFFLKKTPNKILTLLAIPFGIVLTFLIYLKKGK